MLTPALPVDGALADVSVLRRCDHRHTRDLDNNKASAITIGANKPLNNGLQFITQYQHRTTQQVAKSDKTDNTFQVRFIWIF